MLRALFLCCLILLGGCFGWSQRAPLITHDVWHDSRVKKLLESPFRLQVVNFVDGRRPSNMAPMTDSDILYEYDPNDLMNGVQYRLPVMFERQFARSSGNVEPTYMVELELRELRTSINTGGLKSGRFGRYDVALEVAITVRRQDSYVLLEKTYPVELDKVRRSQDGRGPSAEADRQRLIKLVDDATGRIAQQVGWHMREAHRDQVERFDQLRRDADQERQRQEFGYGEY